MKIRLLLLFALFLAVHFSRAQQGKYEMTGPLDIDQLGYNYVITMKNGNTLLFHFQKDKRLLVKVFDSTRKEIASLQEHYKTLNFQLNAFRLKAIFEINDEAVLFFDQDENSRHSLLRLRFNSHTGALAEELVVAESKSEDKRIHFYPIKHRSSEQYELLFCTDKSHPRESDIYIVYFDSLHHSIKEVQLPVDRKKFDGLEVVGAESRPNGVLVTLALTKTMVYALGGSNGPINNRSSTDDHYLQFYYLPFDTKVPQTALIDISTGVFPYSTHYSYDSAVNAINLLMYSYRRIQHQFGQNIQSGNVNRKLFFKLNPNNIASTVGLNTIMDKQADTVLIQATHSVTKYDGRPLKMYTDNRGISTIFSQGVYDYQQQEILSSTSTNIGIRNFAITQVDTNGNEIWGTILPLSQLLNTYSMYPKYSVEFMGVNAHRIGSDYYMVYNDREKNYSKSLSERTDTVFSFYTTNACYYKMDVNRNLTKHYLLGAPTEKEYKCSFISGSWFDEDRRTFATLVQYKKDDEVTLKVAWSHLE